MWMKTLLASALLIVLAGLSTSQAQITTVPNSEASVNAAIDRAKADLPIFFARLAKPDPGDSGFSVKIRYDTTKPNSGEHIWANEVVRSGDMITATISNQPRDIPHLKYGQRVTVPIAHVTDWMYVRGGKYYGAYTVRALLPFMSPKDAEAMRQKLAPE